MKNCLEFTTIKLVNFIHAFGVFHIIDSLRKFQVVVPDIVTLDRYYQPTEDVEQMAFGAVVTDMGYILKAQSDLIKDLVKIICNFGSSEEGIRINSALKSLNKEKNNNAALFYSILSEGLHRRMLFCKLSQIFTQLIEEVKVNQDLLITLNELIDLTSHQDQSAEKIAEYIVIKINTYSLVKRFVYICQQRVRDRNLIEELEEIAYEIEVYQCSRLNEKLSQDSEKKLCLIY